ncbi:hypothetical protein E3P99_00663 [Wallemia hederae]|uniref:Uncharacterized protein n=1 Tax=Wallemia hederae TaxID=1540922 RepID=A0A4T0FX50_9BASI|nr:hypothetical protein E3P99_00663 [Wallemia hederae]
MRLKLVHQNERFLINFESTDFKYIKEYLREFFDLKYPVDLELDGFKVTPGSLRDGDVIHVVRSNKRPRKSSSSSSSSASSDVSSSSASSSSDSSDDEDISTELPTPPYQGTSKTQKRNARNKKKIKFQKFENRRVIPYSSLPTNRVPSNVKVTSVDVEDPNFEPGNNTTHIDWRDNATEEPTQPTEDAPQDSKPHAPQEVAEQIVMEVDGRPDTAAAPNQDILQLEETLKLQVYTTTTMIPPYPTKRKAFDRAVNQLQEIASAKMANNEILTELPPVNSLIAYSELQLNDKNVPEMQIAISHVVEHQEGNIAVVRRACHTRRMVQDLRDMGMEVADDKTPILLDTLQQSNAVLLRA